MSLIGETLDGRYRLLRLIGTGSTGDVYEAEHTGLNRKFAVKILHDALSRQPTFASRFKREGKALARLAHPNIVRVYDACAASDSLTYLVMELVEGERLDTLIRRTGAFKVPRALRIGHQLASAIEHAHQAEVLHRDLRPANLLVKQTATGDGLKVLDFGIAKIIAPDYRESKLLSREYAGTEVLPHYKSPEQLRFTQVDQTCDIYAIGCILYELLTGDRPFAGSSSEIINGHLSREPLAPGKRVAGVPSAVDKLILTCLAKNPRQRFQSGRELVVALEQLEAKHAAPRRRVQIADAQDGPEDNARAARGKERCEVLTALADRLLSVDDPSTDLAASLKRLRTVERQNDLIEHERRVAREELRYLGEWSRQNGDALGSGDFTDEVTRLRAEAETRAERAEARATHFGSALDAEASILEQKIGLLLPRVPPSSEAFLLMNRLKRLRGEGG